MQASAVFYISACSFTPVKVPNTSCTAVRPRLFELTSSDRLSPYIKHHNRAILYSATCFLRAGVSKFTVWEPLMFHTHSQTSVNSQFFLGHANVKRMSSELLRRWNICGGNLLLNENKLWRHIYVGVIGLHYSINISSSNFWMVLDFYLAQVAWKCSFSQQLFFP